MAQRSEKVLIDRKLALKYLEMYGGNRPIRQTNIDRFANLLRNKKFQCTHQGIAFHEKGHLADGQHRLWAIVETGISAWMYVTTGLNDDEVGAIDNGLVRDHKDTAYYAGLKVDPKCWPIAKMLVRGATASNLPLPFDVVRGWYEFYEDGVNFAVQAFNSCQPAKKKMTVPMATAFARAYFGIAETERLTSMLEVMRTGQKSVEADAGAVVLRDAWLTGRMVGAPDQYFKTCAAIRAFVERRRIKTLQRAEIEIWALPKLPSELVYSVTQGHASPRSGREARARFFDEIKPS